MIKRFLLLAGCSFSLNLSANADFQAYLETLQQRADEAGISQDISRAALAQAEYVPRAISADRNQPEQKLTLDEYIPRAVPKWKVQQARALYKKHYPVLEQIAEKYQVQPRFVVALWGVESNFGRYMGNYNVVSALSTMAFEGRREEFFSNQLMDALKILEQQHISIENMKGSWAGAMGQVQFMPSSFLAYAVDQSGDGKQDIWGNTDDALASAANYLHSHGWNDDQTWGRQVRLPEGFDPSLLGLDKQLSLSDLQDLGVRRMDGNDLPQRDLMASVVAPDGIEGRVYLAYDNYRTLMRWNRSYYFVSAVGYLSDAIAYPPVM